MQVSVFAWYILVLFRFGFLSVSGVKLFMCREYAKWFAVLLMLLGYSSTAVSSDHDSLESEKSVKYFQLDEGAKNNQSEKNSRSEKLQQKLLASNDKKDTNNLKKERVMNRLKKDNDRFFRDDNDDSCRLISKNEMISIAEAQTGGKVLSVSLSGRGQGAKYKIRVLVDKKRMKNLTYEACY